MSPLILFAQNGGGGAAGAGFFAFLMVFVGVVFLIALLPQIFFLLTLQKALSRCRPQYRTQEPGMVWLALIPFVNLAWIFINVIRVSESLQAEFRARRWHSRSEDYGYGIGIAYCSLALAGIVPYCGVLFGLAAFVCWIIYWVKVANLSGQLADPASRRDRDDSDDDNYYGDYDDEDEDDRPRRRRDRDDGEDDDRPRRRRGRDDERDDRDDRDDRKPWERR